MLLTLIFGEARAGEFTIRGPVLDVDPAAQLLTVRQPDQTPLKVTVGPGIPVRVDGRDATLADLAKGQKVAVVFSDKKALVRVEVGEPPTPAAKGSDAETGTDGGKAPKDKALPAKPAGGLPVAAAPANSGPVHVSGYYRKDGTYVQPHTRAAPGMGTRRR